MAKKEKNAIVLARVSTLQQELESQTEKVIAAAKGDGYVNPIIIQNKESAVKKDEAHLLGITEMKQYIEAGNVAVVYCSELSRLSRRPKDLYAIRDYLIERGVQLICLNPYFKLLNEEKKLDTTASVVFALYSSFAEQECLLRTERCVRGKIKKRDAGKFIGGKILRGYKRDKDDNFIIDPEGAEVVKRIYNMYVGGKNRLQIARELRAEGYMKNFVNDLASHSHINDVLRNADYTGLHGKPQIISQALFDRAQERLQEDSLKTERKKIKRVALGRSLMINSKSKFRHKKYYVNTAAGTYYCVLDAEESKKKFIAIHKIDPFIWDAVKKVYKQQRDGRFGGKERRVQKQRAANITRRIAHLEEQVKASQGKIDICEERLIMQKISEQRAAELEARIRAEADKAKKQIEELRIELEEIQRSYRIEDIDKLDGDERMALVDRLVHHIDLIPLDEKRGKLQWKCCIYFKRGDVQMFYLDTTRKAKIIG